MYTLLIPKHKSLKEVKAGGGSPFWKSFWDKKVSANPSLYKKQYKNRITRLKTIANSLVLISVKLKKSII